MPAFIAARRIITLSTGGGVIFDFTIVSLGRVIRPATRVIDTRS